MHFALVLQVVNICIEEQAGTGYGWHPEHEHEYVKLVHVMLRNDCSEALVTWGNNTQEVLTVSNAHGQLQFHQSLDVSYQASDGVRSKV